MLNYLSLFSGIGAPEKALVNLGVPFHLVNYCEIDKYASKSYAAVHGVSEDLNLWDVTKITKDDIKERVDLVTHGSPCQSFSISGKQEGGDEGSGTRSSLMYETLRIVGFTNPKFILWENVKNVLSPRHIHNFENYRNRLDALGYNSYWKVLNAKDFGIPQNRERIFCISIRKDIDKGFEFPTPFPLTLKLKDMLDDKVDEKYYLSNNKLSGMISELNPTESLGGCDKSVNNPRLIDYCNCLTTREDRGVSNHKAEGTAVYEQNKIIKVGQKTISMEDNGTGGVQSERSNQERIC